jgi:hypothetical protein
LQAKKEKKQEKSVVEKLKEKDLLISHLNDKIVAWKQTNLLQKPRFK